MFDACEKKPAWPETLDLLVEEAADDAFVETPNLSSSSSFNLQKSLFRSFYRSFSCSTVSTMVTVRLRFTKFEVPIEPDGKARYAKKVREEI